ncbi:MAG: Asp-tRNA(Asn)/Glu-tRNA(Gln) amidotransferase subunit GatC [Candidatus Wolfebacteria bacterium]|nr:Asp-tRNA(Asn)/Glu-tRNA(Gln) amidotransferase subunit GatC [Candidatus Wolfebacteria bacterium]
MTQIDKKTLEHLADLARIKITEKEEDKLVEDLKKILNFFEELRELDTEKIPPMAGGTDLKNTTREDETNKELVKNRDILINSFPEKEGDFLKIPPVFE